MAYDGDYDVHVHVHVAVATAIVPGEMWGSGFHVRVQYPSEDVCRV